MKTLACSVAAVLCLPGVLSAQELEPIPADAVAGFGSHLVELAGKLENPQVEITADVAKANGVHVPEKLGVLVAPQKDLRESEELAAKFKTDTGAAIAYLFAYRVVPMVDGKTIDVDRLHKVTLTGDDGEELTIYTLLLTVRQVSEDDYRLYVYGAEAKPIIDAKFSEGTGPGAEPVAVELKNVNRDEHEADAVVTVFGKYQASFRVGHTSE